MKRDDDSSANDNAGPTRLDDLVADAIEDVAVRAERDIVEGEEPIEASVALVELAAAAMADVFLNAENPELTPELVIRMVSGRMASMLMAEVERSDLLHKPRLAVVKPSDWHGHQAGSTDVGIKFEIDEIEFEDEVDDGVESEDEVAIFDDDFDFDAAYDALMAGGLNETC